MLIQDKPSIHVSEGHLRYVPAVDRLSTNPMHIPVVMDYKRERLESIKFDSQLAFSAYR